ncbi:response regulator [Bacillus sp. N9]
MRERYKVLIVDDEQLIRQGIKHYVNWEQEGFQIVGEAANGKEALEIIKQTDPHIVITDIVMPVIDGEELTRIIKKDYPHIQVIILSSYSDFDYVRSTFQSGVSDYILKPKLNGPELLTALKRQHSLLEILI